MRIAIDARQVQSGLHGIGRHILSLLLGLSYRDSELEFVVIHRSPLVRKVVERSGGPQRRRFRWVRALSGVGSAGEKVEIPWILKVNDIDLYHDTSAAGTWTLNVPKIVTVHELGKATKYLRKVFRGARVVLPVSEMLADELEENFHVSRSKLRVISNGIDPWYEERSSESEIRAVRERFRLQEPYFLCVTSERPSKNAALFESAAQTWKGSQRWVATLPLQQRQNGSGNGGGGAAFAGVLRVGSLEDVWLRPMYTAAEVVVVPSHYEGFSLPPLEALACGTIPVVSDIAAHREILSEILPRDLFFDPTDINALKIAIDHRLQGGDVLRNSILERFRLIRDRYSFLNVAKKVHEVYEKGNA